MGDSTLQSINQLPDITYLRSIFEYNYETGELKWKVNKGNAKNGDIAGTKHNRGYLSVQIDNQSFLVHRIVWAIHHGGWPSAFIDHIDLVKSNNRISNLREASRRNNSQNHGLRKDSTSQHKGVTWHTRLNKWQVRIQVDNKRMHVGYFDSLAEASQKAIECRNKLHKEFANHG